MSSHFKEMMVAWSMMLTFILLTGGLIKGCEDDRFEARTLQVCITEVKDVAGCNRLFGRSTP